jgi:hypothetical protein
VPRYFGSRRYLAASTSCCKKRQAETIRVEIIGPFRWNGRDCRPGDVIRLPVATYRAVRRLGSFQRRYERKTFQGRSYLAVVDAGAIRRGCHRDSVAYPNTETR